MMQRPGAGSSTQRQAAPRAPRGPDKPDTRPWHEIALEWVKVALIPLIVGIGGHYGSKFLSEKQALESNAHLYAELMSRREESDSSLRKDMFNSIIQTFLKASSDNPRRKVLGLELLAYNFHESLDLGPLFKEVYRDIVTAKKLSDDERSELVDRMEKVTREVIGKQVSALEEQSERSGKLDGHVDWEELDRTPGGVTAIDSVVTIKDGKREIKEHFRLEVLRSNRKKRELRVRLHATSGQQGSADQRVDTDLVFLVGYFDFPMLDNTRLPNGQRCAVVLRQFTEDSAELTLVYFPASRASLKDKPYYEDVLREVLHREPR